MGALFALCSAFLWAAAAFMFGHISYGVSSRGLNLGKGIVALLCMVPLIFYQDLQWVASNQMVALGFSGVIGITIGDTLYFLALKRLGARMTLLMGNLIPITTALLSIPLFDEYLSFTAWTGVTMVMFGVGYVLWQRDDKTNNYSILNLGVIFGFLFVFSEASGILLTKYGVVTLGALDATFIRQFWGVFCLLAWGLSVRALSNWIKPLWQPQRLKLFLLAAIVGAFLGTYLSVLALKHTHIAVAATLNSTSPLFAIMIAHFVFKKKITTRELSGVSIATLGIAIYFWKISNSSV